MIAAAVESNSTHPVAKAVTDYAKDKGDLEKASEIEEIPGHGLKGKTGDREVLAGNVKLLKKF